MICSLSLVLSLESGSSFGPGFVLLFALNMLRPQSTQNYKISSGDPGIRSRMEKSTRASCHNIPDPSSQCWEIILCYPPRCSLPRAANLLRNICLPHLIHRPRQDGRLKSPPLSKRYIRLVMALFCHLRFCHSLSQFLCVCTHMVILRPEVSRRNGVITTSHPLKHGKKCCSRAEFKEEQLPPLCNLFLERWLFYQHQYIFLAFYWFNYCCDDANCLLRINSA